MYKTNPDNNRFLHREIYIMNVGPIGLNYDVHHIDKNPSNNSIENLIAIPREFHIVLHQLDKLGVILRNKSDVSIALSFYLKGKEEKSASFIKGKSLKKHYKKFYKNKLEKIIKPNTIILKKGIK